MINKKEIALLMPVDKAQQIERNYLNSEDDIIFHIFKDINDFIYRTDLENQQYDRLVGLMSEFFQDTDEYPKLKEYLNSKHPSTSFIMLTSPNMYTKGYSPYYDNVLEFFRVFDSTIYTDFELKDTSIPTLKIAMHDNIQSIIEKYSKKERKETKIIYNNETGKEEVIVEYKKELNPQIINAPFKQKKPGFFNRRKQRKINSQIRNQNAIALKQFLNA